MNISYMISLYKFENIPCEENTEEKNIIGGAPVQFENDRVDMPIKRFDNLVVPLGLHMTKMRGGYCNTNKIEEHTFMGEAMFSKLFYSTAKDLGGSIRKSRTSITKKKRR